MKSVKRVNPRDRYELLRKGHLPRSPNGVSVADKVNTTEEKIRKEIAIMKKLRHPHVVRLYEVIDDRMREKIYIGAHISLIPCPVADTFTQLWSISAVARSFGKARTTNHC